MQDLSLIRSIGKVLVNQSNLGADALCLDVAVTHLEVAALNLVLEMAILFDELIKCYLHLVT